MVARRRHRAMSAVGAVGPRRGRWVLIAVLLAAGCGALAACGSGQDHAILIAVQRFMLEILGWPLAILHGLLGGRAAQPYVDWSYGACVAAVALALVIRLVSTTRSRAEVAPHPVPGRAAFGTVADAPTAAVVAGQQGGWLPPAPAHRAWPRGAQHGGIRHDGGWHDGGRHHNVRHNAVQRQVEPR